MEGDIILVGKYYTYLKKNKVVCDGLQLCYWNVYRRLTSKSKKGNGTLTLKWPRYFYSRWCPLKKTTFPPEFCNEICTIYVRAIQNHNSAKKFWKCCTVSKWRPNNRFWFRVISILAKIWKTFFPKEFFNEIWLKVGEYEYIYITEITL